MTRDIGVAQRLVKKRAKTLGITPDRTGFASVPPGERLLDAVETVSLPTTRLDLRGADGREPVFGISRFVPVHGDDVLIGSKVEEMNLYLIPSGVRDNLGRLLAWFVLRKSQPRAGPC